MIRPFAALFAGAALAVLAVAACNTETITVPHCGALPAGGCPYEDGLACADRTCAAGYTCGDDDKWAIVLKCPNYDPDGGSDAWGPQPTFDAGQLRDVGPIDVPPGANGAGCDPTENDDCWLASVLQCPVTATDPCCGCAALFLCSSGEMELWGYCSAEAGVYPAK